MTREHKNSAALFEQAYHRIPAGVNSNTRARKPHPIYFERAAGPHVWDVDGNRYVDVIMGNGAILLGHGDPGVQDAVAKALETGLTNGLEWERAAEVADLFLKCVPTMDLVRFTNTGTEAVLHALHLARHATGRARVAKVEGSYHGWSDEMFVSVWADIAKAGTPDDIMPLPGMPGLARELVDAVLVMPFNDIERSTALIERHAGDLAAVILEPVMINMGFIEPARDYLQALREACTKHGVVLIFDELLTGFNLAPGGAQEVYGVTPDLATYGKALANGYPIAALAGSEDLMRMTEPGKGPAFVGTFNGHVVSLAAASAALPVLTDGSVQKTVGARNKRLAEAFGRIAQGLGVPAQLLGGGSHFHWYFTPNDVRDYRSAATTSAAAYGAFAGALFDQGIIHLPNPLSHHAISLAHDDSVLDALENAFRVGLEAAVVTAAG